MTKWRYPVIFQILSNLALHESGAVAIMEANVLNSMEKLLRSRPTDPYQHIFSMLKSLTSYESTCPHAPPPAWDSLAVVDRALWLISRVPHLKLPPVTAGTVSVEAMLLHHIVNMLEAPNAGDKQESLLFLIRFSQSPREDPKGRKRTPTAAVIDLLTRMARWREGAEGMVAAKVLNDVLDGLQSFDPQIRSSTCLLLLELVGHESTVEAVIATVPRNDIGALLRDKYYKVREYGADILQILDATLERIGNSLCQ
ncbi:hypothetical protein C8J57DRAFT_1250511 [Mycena rebaudengoi]|nr:hypothetical protein C8J57DRAFT_1250511 [Mycena rebaudengoi]